MTEDEELDKEYEHEPEEPEEIDDEDEWKHTETTDKPETDENPVPLSPMPEEPCDPLTMDCDQMRDHIIGLADERIRHKNAIDSLKSAKLTIIGNENLDKIIKDEEEKLKKVDDEIYGTFEKFSVCTTKPKSRIDEQVEGQPVE